MLDRKPKPTGQYRLLAGQTQLVATGAGNWPEERPVAIPVMQTEYQIRHLQQWDIGTSYNLVVDDTVAIAEQIIALEAAENAAERQYAEPGEEWFDFSPAILGVDHTGVGRAVVDQLRAKPCPLPMIAVTITAGQTSNAREQSDSTYRPWTVPKKELVGPMLVAVQNGTLKVAPDLELARQLDAQMQAFRMKMRGTSGVTYEAEHERDHDDLVIAVSIAAWLAHKIDQQAGGVWA